MWGPCLKLLTYCTFVPSKAWKDGSVVVVVVMAVEVVVAIILAVIVAVTVAVVAVVVIVVVVEKFFLRPTIGGVILKLGALPEPWDSENTPKICTIPRRMLFRSSTSLIVLGI